MNSAPSTARDPSRRILALPVICGAGTALTFHLDHSYPILTALPATLPISIANAFFGWIALTIAVSYGWSYQRAKRRHNNAIDRALSTTGHGSLILMLEWLATASLAHVSMVASDYLLG